MAQMVKFHRGGANWALNNRKREEHLKQNEQNNRDLKVLLENEESPNEAGGGEDELKGIRVVISVKDRIWRGLIL